MSATHVPSSQFGAYPTTQPTTSQPVPALHAQQQNPSSHPLQKFREALRGLGIAESVIGTISIALAIGAFVIATAHEGSELHYWHYCDSAIAFAYISQGIWCGVLVIVTGILGIALWKNTSRAMYIANMTMAIFTANVVAAGLVISGLGAVISSPCNGALSGMHAVVAILCFVAMIISIVHAALCCSGVCYSSQDTRQVIKPMQFVPQRDPIYEEPYLVFDQSNGAPTSVPFAVQQGNPPAYEEPMSFK